MAAERTILHADMNSCFASIELLYHPELRGRPLAVGGDPAARHGIVLAKDELAKKAGVKTGMALWQARQACPELQFVAPRMDIYLRFSRMAHEIYSEYTDLQEPFGIDESWLDVSGSVGVKGDGRCIAEELRQRIKRELGITVSIGVSWNKIFAKFGSDYKKPDAVTVISRDNYRDIVWSRPVEDLFYVGPATQRQLNRRAIYTIGQLACTDPELLHLWLGKMGYVLSAFANGRDQTPVSPENSSAPIKSIGNSTTSFRDLRTDQDVAIIVQLLAESVASRLRDNGFAGYVIGLSIRDNALHSFTRQCKIEIPTNLSTEISRTAMVLFHASYHWEKPIRSIGVRVSELVTDTAPYQLDLYTDPRKRQELLKLERTVDSLRSRFGYEAIQRGCMYRDRQLSRLNPKEDHIIHPQGYMERGNRVGV